MEGRNLSAALEIATATHPGMVRSHNEDSIMVDADIGDTWTSRDPLGRRVTNTLVRGRA